MKRGIVCAALTGLLTAAQPTMAATQAQIDAAWNKGLAWLMTNQHGDGGWSSTVSDGNVTRQALGFQATAAVVEALANINTGISLKTGYTFMGGVAWLSNAEPASVEAASRQILALKAAGEDVTALATKLASWRNSGFSWGAFPQYEAGLPDNALGILSLMDAQGTGYNINELFSAVCAVMVGQRPTPNFLFPYDLWTPGLTPSTPPTGLTTGGVIPSAYALMAVNKAATRFPGGTCNSVVYDIATVVTTGVTGVVAKKNADNGFGDNGSSAILETALALRALKTVAPTNAAAVTAFDYLIATQAVDGSWAGDALQTAEVMLALAAPTTATGQRPSATVVADTDKDGIPNDVETVLGTNPAVADSRFLADGSFSVITQPTLLRAAAAIVQAPSAASLISETGTQSPSTWNRAVDRELFIAGSSLQMTTLGDVLASLFAPSTAEVLLDDGGAVGAEQGHAYRAYYGTVAGSGIAGLDGQRLLIHVSSQGGSYAGAAAVARAISVARMVIDANCSDSNNNHRWSCPIVNTVMAIPEAGLSDVQPALHVGVNVAPGGMPITASDVARLNAAPINALVLGPAVTRSLRNAGLTSLSRTNLASILSGKTKSSWNELAGQLPAQPVILCRMNDGAQPAANAVFLKYACDASAALPAVASSSVGASGGPLRSPGYLVVNNATADEVSACLNKADQGGTFQIGSTQVNVPPGSFAVGILGRARQPAADDRWTYLAVDGVDASKANVAGGKYPAYTEAWMQWRRAAANGVAAPNSTTLELLKLLRQRLSNAEILQGLNGILPLSDKTAAAKGIITMNLTTQGDACKPPR